MRRADPLIVGGGPAGTAAALALATGGARPRLIERTLGAHDVVCGAFLGWDAVAGLGALGIDVWSLGARPIERVRLVTAGRTLDRRLPRRAAALSRRLLDETLLAAARQRGVEVSRGVSARRLDGHVLHLSDGSAVEPDTLFLATGKHALRGSPRDGATGRYVGLRATLPGSTDLAGTIELHLLDGGYAGLLLQEDGCSNLCLSIGAERLARAGSPAALIAELAREAPALAERFDGVSPEWLAVSGVPYGWIGRETAPGLFRLGDQAAVIASLAGDGIAVALASGRAAAAAWLAAEAAPAFQRRFAARAGWPIRVAEALRHAAERPPLAAALLAGPARLPGALALAARLTRIGA